MATHSIMLDFDKGNPTTDDLIELQQKWEFDSYLFSSQNHQKPKKLKSGKTEPPVDRLRVLIPLSEPIRDEFDRKAVQQAMVAQYNNVDKTFMGQTRYFAHGTTEVSSFVSDRGAMNWKIIPNLYESLKKKGRPSSTEQLKQTFRLDDTVLDGNNIEYSISELPSDIPIFCLVCGKASFRKNGSHNAVKKINNEGFPFIYCSSCDSRGMGFNGSGVYNLHPDDMYKMKTEQMDAFVFIDTLKSKYFGCCEEPGLDEHVIRDLKTREHVDQFREFHELPKPKAYPRARYELVFNSDNIVDYDNGYVNKYIPPKVLINPVPNNNSGEMPKYIGHLIDHVFAHDKIVMDHFINDFAYFIQYRQKMTTAYLLQGTEGTGKGVLMSLVIQEIFGHRYCSQTDQDAFGGQFNSFLTDNVFVLVNEVSGNFASSDYQNLSTIEKMKIAITDEHIQIEGKNKDRFNGKNVCSFMFATNRRHGLILGKGDRRFSVAPRQELKIANTTWWPGYRKLKQLIAGELQDFVWYMKHFRVDESKIATVIDNEPKQALQAMSVTTAEDFFDAVLRGDVDWLSDNISSMSHYNWEQESHFDAKQILDGLRYRKGIRIGELHTIYCAITHKKMNLATFRNFSRGYLPKVGTIRDGNQTYKGISVDWS